jgi:hypothetical protein
MNFPVVPCVPCGLSFFPNPKVNWLSGRLRNQEILNMVSAISNSHPTELAAQPPAKPAAQKAPSQGAVSTPAPAPTTAKDTVQVSSAAKALLQESQETSVQTAREANSGDQQAIRLQAKRAATKAGLK